MTELSRIANAAVHLRAAYGSPDIPDWPNAWLAFVSILLVGPTGGAANEGVKVVLESSALASPGSTAQTSTGQLVELLAGVPRGPQKASLLRAVAEWWLAQFGDKPTSEWSKGLDFYRESLRKIRGLGPATVDELLMFAARLPVFPLDRATLRVAIRHGWLDFPIEDDAAQDFFVRGLKEAEIDPRQFSWLISRVAEAHCGRVPQCDGCPLQPLLPLNGPLNPDSC